MGDSYDGGEANDSTESSGSVENSDSGDDSSAFYGGDIGEEGTGDTEVSSSGEGIEYIGETPENIAPKNSYGDGGVTTDAPDEVSQDIPEELESEMSDETEVNEDGDEESAYEDESEDFSEEKLEALQERADNAAQEYNDKYSPYNRAVSKGVEGVTKTPNGGVSFENSDALYVTEDGTKGVVTIEATGSRSADFDMANKLLGLDEKPDGYTWHHLDNYNVKDNTVTLELVRDDAHNSAKPHSGGCAQYDTVHGPAYNPPRQ